MEIKMRCFSKFHRNCRLTTRTAVLLFSLVLFADICLAQTVDEKDMIEVETEGEYQMREGDSRRLAKQLALFEAKRTAVDAAERYLSHKGLIEFYGKKKQEIFSITATMIQVKVQEEKWIPGEKKLKYMVKIRSRIHATDFIKAEIRDLELEDKESKASLREELEPHLSGEADPGNDIAKAFRLYRKDLWRAGLLYINRLEKRYPNWGEIYLAKAIAFYVLHETTPMKEALIKGCNLGAKKACEDLKMLKRVHQLDVDF